MKANGTDWKEVKLGSILRYLDERVSMDDEKEYLTITVKRRHGGLEIREKLFGHQIATKKQFRLVPGAFIISRVQCWHQAYAIVGNVTPNTIASTNYDQFAILPQVDPRFFWWLSHSPAFTETVRSSAVGVVIEKMVFNRDEWLSKSVRLPPLTEQRRVVARIEQLAAQIHEARNLRRQAAEEAEALFTSRVSTSFREDGIWKRVEDAISSRKGAVRSGPFGSQLLHEEFTDSGVIAIGTRDVQTNRFQLQGGWFISPEKFEQFRRYQIFARDVLCTIVGASIGRFCVVPDDVPLAFTTKHIQALTLDSTKVDPRFASLMLNFHRTCRDSLFAQVEGSAQPSLNAGKILATALPLPSLPEQRRIVAQLDALQAEVDALKRLQAESAAELDALLPAILDRAFKGEL